MQSLLLLTLVTVGATVWSVSPGVAVSLLEAGPSPGAAVCRDCSLPEGLEALPQLGVSRSCRSRAHGTE